MNLVAHNMQRMKSLAAEVMSPGGHYFLGYLSTTESGQSISAPFSLDGDSTRSASPVKKK